MFTHEQVVVRRGTRSGVPIIVAVHSTERGPAIGGCRLWRYPHWRDGVADALRLAEGMTEKAASAGLAHGGAKTVVALPPDEPGGPVGALDEPGRRAVLLDVGELVESFGGRYLTGPDVGTSPADMATIAEATRHVFCRPESDGGSGDCSPHTAAGVLAAMHAVAAQLDGVRSLAGRRVTLVGLGHVGGHLARALAAEGARLTVTDLDPAHRALAAELGARWVAPDDAPLERADILVPAALGGLLTTELVPALRCRAVVGPANNQLAEPAVGELLRRHGIRWVPDTLASAGGVIYAVSREVHGADHNSALRRVRDIEGTVSRQLRDADARVE